MPELPRRKHLNRTPPSSWVSDSDFFFLTLNGMPRGLDQFATERAGRLILNTARFHHERHGWYCRLLVAMPDHLHLLAAFPREVSMKVFVTAWKGFLTKKAGVAWQRDFFDHRIRNDENLDAKADYIRQNPVRAGLTGQYEDWPWKWDVYAQ